MSRLGFSFLKGIKCLDQASLSPSIPPPNPSNPIPSLLSLPLLTCSIHSFDSCRQEPGEQKLIVRPDASDGGIEAACFLHTLPRTTSNLSHPLLLYGI